jgi:hypothetical protein
VSRQLGEVELTARPTATANVKKINESAAPPIAPAITGVHCKYRPSSSDRVTASMLMFADLYRRPKNESIAKITTIRPTR